MLRYTGRQLYKLADVANRDSITKHGFRAGSGWIGGPGVYATTEPESWLWLFYDTGIYARTPDEHSWTTEVDVWSVDPGDLLVEPDTNEAAELGEDFVIRGNVLPERIRLVRTISL